MLSLNEYKTKLTNEGSVDWSLEAQLEFFWCFEVTASRENIWTYLSDTSRFNRELGFGKRKQIEKDKKLIVSTRMLGFRQEWIEEPWTWLAGHTITSTRNYLHGMAKSVQSVFHIEEDPRTNRRRVYLYFGWNAKNSFWNFFLKATAPVLKKNFGKVFLKLDRHFAQIKSHDEKAFRVTPQSLDESARKKVSEAQIALEKRHLSQSAIERIVELITGGDDLDLEPIKLVPLIRSWGLSEKEVLSTALHATRLGLFKMSWDLICPHCRGSRLSAESLGAIPELSTCEICDIEFSSSQENSVEIMFHVHPSIRKIEALSFCAAEPAKKSHIRLQQMLKPQGRLSVGLKLIPGTYRARLNGQKGEVKIEVSESSHICELEFKAMDGQTFEVNPEFRLRYDHQGHDANLFILENLWWESSALKPSQIFALSEFRDLFSEEHLTSNVKLYLGEQTILFTDIVGSTNFYNEKGDAKAFAEVRIHFQEVFAKVQNHRGVVVKTIGDAVMAAFQSPREAINAAIEIQELFTEQKSQTSIRLRISVHYGPVIAVHLNTGIDYFGNTVNYAAKIQGVAGAGEIALSKEVFQVYLKSFEQKFEIDVRENKRDGGVPGEIFVVRTAIEAKNNVA